MAINPIGSILPTKLKYRMMVGFCLMSILPLLAGAYIASLFIHFPFGASQASTTVVTLVGLLSLSLSLLGFHMTKQMMMPIEGVSAAAQNIAAGKVDQEIDAAADTTDEIQDLSRSLKRISQNAKELLEKVEKLSLRDKLTGLYNASYIRERLDEEIQRAIHYQRPCSFASLLVTNYDGYILEHGEAAAEEAMKKVADVFNEHMREFDRAARIGGGEFVIIFPDKNKKKSIEVVEKVCQKIATLSFGEGTQRLVLSAGISENPIDGVQADGLFVKAQDRMKMAKAGQKMLEAFA